MPTTVVKRSISIRGHQTSISIENEFWARLQTIARDEAVSVAQLVARIDAGRPPSTNLSSAIRLFVLDEALSRLPPLERTVLVDAEA